MRALIEANKHGQQLWLKDAHFKENVNVLVATLKPIGEAWDTLWFGCVPDCKIPAL